MSKGQAHGSKDHFIYSNSLFINCTSTLSSVKYTVEIVTSLEVRNLFPFFLKKLPCHSEQENTQKMGKAGSSTNLEAVPTAPRTVPTRFNLTHHHFSGSLVASRLVSCSARLHPPREREREREREQTLSRVLPAHRPRRRRHGSRRRQAGRPGGHQRRRQARER